MRADLAGGSTP